ncbi:MAG: class I SAM-dependent methyltransferase [Acidimicrobiales bacterium]|jgi:16S rRNA (guanine1207-N2)-methyltransferase|nr:class I SAM-dependent methyltransferase [Acidimicrobiales bacterium]
MVESHPQYFEPKPQVASRRRTVTLELEDLSLQLATDTGVFSGDRVDPGTRLLLQEAPALPPGAARLLDLGCGYGPLAVAMARRAPDAEVWAVDVNERAVALCAENAAANDAAGVRAVLVDAEGDPVDPAVTLRGFDVIWSNPPIRIGKPALHRLLTTWLDRLSDDGRAVLVVQKHLGADSLARWMDEQGWTTTRRTSRAGYRLLDVSARPPSPGTDP